MAENETQSVADYFNFEVLKDFCKVRNTAIAGKGGPNPSPRLIFIMNLLDEYGIEYELDRWEKEPRFTTTLENYFGFTEADIDDVIDNMPYNMPHDQLLEERRILESAFEWFELSLDELNALLDEAEYDNHSLREIRMLNTLIRLKQRQIVTSTNEVYFNLYLKGNSDKMIMAHHDVANVKVDNTNDNSASVINAIACKILMPDLNVAITDGEEVGGIGARRAAEKINEGHFGEIEFVLNFELTAVGGKNFFIEDHHTSNLFKRVQELFPGVETHHTPFHDGIVLRSYGIDSIVINPLPRNKFGRLDYSILHYCHSSADTIDLANFNDMKDFCEEVVRPIITGEEPNFKISDMIPDVVETPTYTDNYYTGLFGRVKPRAQKKKDKPTRYIDPDLAG